MCPWHHNTRSIIAHQDIYQGSPTSQHVVTSTCTDQQDGIRAPLSRQGGCVHTPRNVLRQDSCPSTESDQEVTSTSQSHVGACLRITVMPPPFFETGARPLIVMFRRSQHYEPLSRGRPLPNTETRSGNDVGHKYAMLKSHAAPVLKFVAAWRWLSGCSWIVARKVLAVLVAAGTWFLSLESSSGASRAGVDTSRLLAAVSGICWEQSGG